MFNRAPTTFQIATRIFLRAPAKNGWNQAFPLLITIAVGCLATITASTFFIAIVLATSQTTWTLFTHSTIIPIRENLAGIILNTDSFQQAWTVTKDVALTAPLALLIVGTICLGIFCIEIAYEAWKTKCLIKNKTKPTYAGKANWRFGKKVELRSEVAKLFFSAPNKRGRKRPTHKPPVTEKQPADVGKTNHN